MAKFEVTPALAIILKSARAQNNVTAKSVAEHIKKSSAFISKLEKAQIKTISEALLTNIFQFIYQNNENPKSLELILETIYKTLEIKFTDEEIEQQLWWENYDTVLRRIPIPANLIDDINERMKRIHLTVDELCVRINANEAILHSISNIERYPFNEWQAYVNNHKLEFSFIRIKTTVEILNKIFNKETTNANYITLLSISYYLHKIEKFNSQVDIPQEDNNKLNRIARDYLNKYRFFSIAEKSKLARAAKNDEERESLFSTFDRENRDIVQKIILNYKLFSDIDIERSNIALAVLLKNLEWDLGFMMALTNLSFSDLENISYANKMNLLSEIHKLVIKYKEIPKEKRALDNYDVSANNKILP